MVVRFVLVVIAEVVLELDSSGRLKFDQVLEAEMLELRSEGCVPSQT